MGAHATSSMGRTVSPSVASKNIAPLAFSLQSNVLHEDSKPHDVRSHVMLNTKVCMF